MSVNFKSIHLSGMIQANKTLSGTNASFGRLPRNLKIPNSKGMQQLSNACRISIDSQKAQLGEFAQEHQNLNIILKLIKRPQNLRLLTPEKVIRNKVKLEVTRRGIKGIKDKLLYDFNYFKEKSIREGDDIVKAAGDLVNKINTNLKTNSGKHQRT